MPPAESAPGERSAAARPLSTGMRKILAAIGSVNELRRESSRGLHDQSNTEPRQHHHAVPRVSIYVLVFAMVVALTAPAVGLLGYIVEQAARERQQQISIRGAQLAGEIADRLSQEFTSLRTILSVFASSGWLEDGELGVLHERARRALAGTDRHLVVLYGRGWQLLNTRVEFGASLGQQVETGLPAADHGQPTGISDVVQDQTTGGPVFNVFRPVQYPDGRRHTLVLSRDTAGLSELLGSTLGEPNWSFAVLDSAGQVATKLVSLAESNKSVPAECRDGTLGFRTWGTPEETQFGFVRGVNGAPWYVCTWVAAEHVAGKTDDLWKRVFTGAMAWLGVAVLAGLVLSAGVSRSIARTARVGEALKAGREVAIGRSIISEIDKVRQFLAGAAAERIRRDERLQLVLRETAHRAKNQLALAASLVQLSSRNAATPAELKDDLVGRLLALSRSIDAITNDRNPAARLDELITAQLAPFIDAAGDRLQLSGPEVTISEASAQSVGLVLHELATNASKYGAWSRPDGKVVIEWDVTESDLVLDWIETGVSNANSDRHGFGTVLLDTLISSLGGSIDRELAANGFSCHLRLSLERLKRSP